MSDQQHKQHAGDGQAAQETPRTDAVCAEINLDVDGYPKQTYEALCRLSKCSRILERELSAQAAELARVREQLELERTAKLLAWGWIKEVERKLNEGQARLAEVTRERDAQEARAENESHSCNRVIADLAAAKEDLAVATSQVENADVNLAQQRLVFVERERKLLAERDAALAAAAEMRKEVKEVHAGLSKYFDSGAVVGMARRRLGALLEASTAAGQGWLSPAEADKMIKEVFGAGWPYSIRETLELYQKCEETIPSDYEGCDDVPHVIGVILNRLSESQVEADKLRAERDALDSACEAHNERISWLEQQREVECQQKEAALRESGECLATADKLRAACAAKDATLKFAAETFRHYEQLHRAKGTPEAEEKAISNARCAYACENAMTTAGQSITDELARKTRALEAADDIVCEECKWKLGNPAAPKTCPDCSEFRAALKPTEGAKE